MSRKIDKSLGGRLEEIADSAAINFKSLIMDHGVNLNCESEIEGILATVFLASQTLDYYNGTECRWRTYGWTFDDHPSIDDITTGFLENNTIIVTPQVVVGGYRVDLLCSMRMYDWLDDRSKTIVLAIECDGHEFHEKTKEQAARDKSRDRELLLRSIPVMRFAGSEIWRDPFGCMRQIDSFFHGRLMAFFDENPDH
jgi:very-short-patch-repair endonuclease